MIGVPAENVELVKKVLKNKYLFVDISGLTIHDNVVREDCSVDFKLGANNFSYAGHGVGLVDAIFNGLKNVYADDYQSLNSIELVRFLVRAKSEGTAAEVAVEVTIKNSFGTLFDFLDHSRSLAGSCARVCAAVVEYFINSEKACIALHSALQDAVARDRQDLVVRYTGELAQLVRSTSYAEVLERIQKQLNK